MPIAGLVDADAALAMAYAARPWSSGTPSASGGVCPRSQLHDDALYPAVYGAGPIVARLQNPVALSHAPDHTDGLSGFKVLWIASPQSGEPVLIRGRNIGDGTSAQFLANRPYTAMQQRGPLLWFPMDDGTGGFPGAGQGWRNRTSEVLLPEPGCYVFEAVGRDTVETVLVLEAVP